MFAVAASVPAALAVVVAAPAVTRTLRRVGLVEAVEANLARLGVDLDDLHLHRVALGQHVFDRIHPPVGHARDVQQAVFGRRQLHEGAEGLDVDHRALELLAHLGLFDNQFDAALGLLAARIGRGDEDRAVLLDVDVRAGLLLQAADDLAARANDVANLVHRHVDRDDARRELGQLLARRGDLGQHGLEYARAPAFGLRQRLGQDVGGQALGLVVHLQSRDAFGRARDLEVHVAQEVLEALDVGQDDVAVAFLDKAHGHARDRALDGHAGVHQGQRRAAGRGHRRRAVGLHHLGDDADGVGEGLLVGQHRLERAAGQGAVPQFAALRGAHAAGLARAVGREVVVVDVTLALGRVDGVEALPLAEHP